LFVAARAHSHVVDRLVVEGLVVSVPLLEFLGVGAQGVV